MPHVIPMASAVILVHVRLTTKAPIANTVYFRCPIETHSNTNKNLYFFQIFVKNWLVFRVRVKMGRHVPRMVAVVTLVRVPVDIRAPTAN